MDDHKIIWLAPICHDDGNNGREWCQDNVWEDGCDCDKGGHEPTRYIRADLFADARANIPRPTPETDGE